jgi:hypothetical protein
LLRKFDTTTDEKIEVWPCGCKSINGSRSRHSDACRKAWLVNERAKRANGITESIGDQGKPLIVTNLFHVSSSEPDESPELEQWSLGLWTTLV